MQSVCHSHRARKIKKTLHQVELWTGSLSELSAGVGRHDSFAGAAVPSAAQVLLFLRGSAKTRDRGRPIVSNPNMNEAVKSVLLVVSALFPIVDPIGGG